MILRSTDVGAALRDRARGRRLQRGFFTLPGGLGASARGAAGGGGGSGRHRYWRLTGFQVSGSLMEISELQLFNGGNSLIPSVTASNTPSGGAVADLNDGSLSSRCYWADTVVEAGGFYVRWDFGSPRLIDGIKIGAFDTSSRYPSNVTLQYSDDNSAWTTQASASGLTYPGNNTLSALIAMGTGTAHRYWRLNGFQVSGSLMEISELQLFDGSDIAKATTSASSAPSGTLADLFDGSLATRVSWTDTVAEAGGFYVRWDFGGTGVAVDGIKIGAFDTSSRYPSNVTLQYSDDNSAWTTFGSASGLTYPGNNTLSALITPS